MTKKYMKKIAAICLALLPACSVVKATNQPEVKDLSVLHLYNSRSLIIGEIGTPTETETSPTGIKIDTFSFSNGYSAAVRSLRAVSHGVADVATLGAWEIVATPIEGEFNGSKVNGQAFYNADGNAIKLEFYEDGKEIINQVAPEYTRLTAATAAAPAPGAAAPIAQPQTVIITPQPAQ